MDGWCPDDRRSCDFIVGCWWLRMSDVEAAWLIGWLDVKPSREENEGDVGFGLSSCSGCSAVVVGFLTYLPSSRPRLSMTLVERLHYLIIITMCQISRQ